VVAVRSLVPGGGKCLSSTRCTGATARGNGRTGGGTGCLPTYRTRMFGPSGLTEDTESAIDEFLQLMWLHESGSGGLQVPRPLLVASGRQIHTERVWMRRSRGVLCKAVRTHTFALFGVTLSDSVRSDGKKSYEATADCLQRTWTLVLRIPIFVTVLKGVPPNGTVGDV
jgi:hypothetical protein